MDNRINIRIPNEARARLDEQCAKLKRDKSDLLREMVLLTLDYIDEMEGEWYTPMIVPKPPPVKMVAEARAEWKPSKGNSKARQAAGTASGGKKKAGRG